MRFLFVADGRSPTALSWLQYWVKTSNEVHLVSTFPCEPPLGLASFTVIPTAFGGMARASVYNKVNLTPTGGLIERFRGPLRSVRYLLGPLSLPPYQNHFRTLVEEIRPDIVHALRIPFEGMLASITPVGIPFVISIWGNDITLHARGSILMARLTRRTLLRADGLIADTSRDIRLGREWGFTAGRPTLVVPGAGGIQINKIDQVANYGSLPEELPEVPIVVNPRGPRPGSLRQDVFFQSIPLVLKKIPQALFICPLLAGDTESERWVKSLGIRPNTKLWPRLDQAQMWALYKKARVYVSPSIHDGLPNSFLEAMACGCFPVVGYIESMQEWITSGVNGFLVDATSPRAIADGIVAALENPVLCGVAKKINASIIANRASFQCCMSKSHAFYLKLLRGIP